MQPSPVGPLICPPDAMTTRPRAPRMFLGTTGWGLPVLQRLVRVIERAIWPVPQGIAR